LEFWLKSVRKCNHNTTIKYISNLRKIVNICLRRGWLLRDPFLGFKMTKLEVERNALTDEDLQIMAGKVFSMPRLDHVRDIFLFSCYTGLAYAFVATTALHIIAWLVLIIFCIQSGLIFSGIYDLFMYWKRAKSGASDLTFLTYSGSSGIYLVVKSYLYLYIPLVTMGIMSQEFSSGSVKLLYSSPVTNTQIVIGKYIALLCFDLMLIGVLLVFNIFSLFTVQHVDIPLIFCGLSGLFLLIAAYEAIGLFMSSISSYVVVAAMGTFALFAVLSMVGGIGQSIAFVRDITYWLSINSRASVFISGLITSEDFIYFLTISILFLCLTVFRLRFKRQPSTFIQRFVQYGAVVLIAITIGYLSAQPDFKGYIDVTRNKVNTLNKGSQDIVSKLPEDVTITTYVNVLARGAQNFTPDRFKSEQKRYEDYVRFKPRLKLEYVYYYHKTNESSLYQKPSKMSEKELLDSTMQVNRWDFDVIPYADIQPKVDLAPEGFRQVSLIRGSNNKTAWLRTYDDALVVPFEPEISAALKRLNQRLPVVGVVTGQGERSINSNYDQGYQRFTIQKGYRNALVNQGFDVQEVSMDRPVAGDISILVLADPKAALSATQTKNLHSYLISGKNLMILGEPGDQDYLNPILSDLGVQLIPGTLLDTVQHSQPNLMCLKPSANTILFSTYFNDMFLRHEALYMPITAAINISGNKGYAAQVLLASGPKSWIETRKMDFSRDSIQFPSSDVRKKGAYPTVIALSKDINGKKQKIIVTGDADFLSNGQLFQTHEVIRAGNYNFIPAAFEWLSDGIAPVDDHRPDGIDNDLNISDRSWKIYSVILRWIFPLILILIACIIYVRRKSR
jgi:ABC-2 type transport system permease protein